jgi:hypothetical protein
MTAFDTQRNGTRDEQETTGKRFFLTGTLS